MSPALVFLIVLAVALAAYGVCEWCFRVSFRRDAIALATRHAWMRHVHHGRRVDRDCPICGDEAREALGVKTPSATDSETDT